MDIDIIDLNDEKYQNLSAVQLALVREAQVKKNEIMYDAQQETEELFRLMLSNRAVRSSVIADKQLEISRRAEEEVDVVRDTLMYQLAYEGIGSTGNEYGPYRYPENPNYNLSPSQRFIVVRSYYMTLTDDAEARLLSYSMDTLARQYLGEFYVTLYDLLAAYC